MDIINKRVDELIPYVNNPRRNEKAIDKVASSIKNFGFKVPIIIDSNNEIVAGHTRLEASKKLGMDEVPCIVADDLTQAQIKAFRIADNRVAQEAEWDEELLRIELEELEGFYDGTDLGFSPKEISKLFNEMSENPYTKKIQTPVYEVKGDNPELVDLVDDMKTRILIEKIEASGVTEDQKEFLKKAAYRHLVFNYSNIAEYYAHQGTEMQELMEESALVIIDYEKAIELGFVELSKSIEELMEK